MKGLLFTYALTYGGAAVSLFNPWVGLLIYICFAIIRPESLWHWSVPAGNYSRIVAIALLLGWTFHRFGRWDLGGGRKVTAALLAYSACAVASACFAPNQEVAWNFVENLSKIVLPFLVGITLLDSVARLKQLAWTIMLSQGYVAYDLNMSYYDGLNRLHQMGFGGMDNNCVSIAMVAGSGLAFFLGLGERAWWKKLLAFAAAALMAHCPMFGFSRGGMLGLIVTGMVAFVLIPKQPRHYAAFLLAVVVGLRLAGPAVVERFASTFADAAERDRSAQSRVEMWGICVDVMLANPLVGVGPDHFPLKAKDLGLSEGKEAHTLWLQIGAELGVTGLACLLAFYGRAIVGLWRYRRDDPWLDPFLPDASRMVIASLVGFVVSAQFVSLEGLELPYYITLIGAGVLKLAGEV